MIKILTVILGIIFTVNSLAQTLKIYDKSDMQPVSNVSVYNKEKTKKVVTDKKGNADITSFSDNDTICISHVTYLFTKIRKTDLAKLNYELALSDNIIRLDEVVFSANKTKEKKSDLPNKIDIVSAKEISFNNPQSSGDLLMQTGNVFIQQSQMGGSSPVIRGFEANKVLIVIDGVRMNNAVYRGGHLQNVITIDPAMLERTEIVYGPGSVIYGSDAFGGVVHFYTKNPELSSNGEIYLKGNAFTRYSSANNEGAGSFNINFGFEKVAFLTSVSFKNLGDLRMGGEKNPFLWKSTDPNFGLCKNYSDRVNGVDSMFINSNPFIQKHTGFYQYDLMQKVLYQQSPKHKFIANFQFSNSSNIPRNDRLSEYSGAKLKYSEWYYGPQTRFLGSVRAEFCDSIWLYDQFNVTAAYQNISEDRINRRFSTSSSPANSNNLKSNQEETVDVFSLNLDFLKKITPKNELRYGTEEAFNNVASKAYTQNIITLKESFNIASRYPDAGSTLNTIAAYITHNWEANPSIIFSQGIRFSLVNINSEYSDTMMKITNFPFDKKFSQQSAAVNGHLGVVYLPGRDWRFALMVSTGFRAPNVDDISKINDSKGSSNLLVIPNPDLKPEYIYNVDLTLAKTINKMLQLEVTGFYSVIQNAITLRPALLNGQDLVVFQGFQCKVQSNQNENRANVYGLQGGGQCSFQNIFQ